MPCEIDRFMAKVVPVTESGCWLWIGAYQGAGYGHFGIGSQTDGTRKTVLAHRYAYEHFVGQIPEGMFLCHKCDVRCCVNPAHIFVGTNRDNIQDAHNKGRYPVGRKFTSGDIREMHLASRRGETQRTIAARFSADQSYVSQVLRGIRRGSHPQDRDALAALDD